MDSFLIMILIGPLAERTRSEAWHFSGCFQPKQRPSNSLMKDLLQHDLAQITGRAMDPRLKKPWGQGNPWDIHILIMKKEGQSYTFSSKKGDNHIPSRAEKGVIQAAKGTIQDAHRYYTIYRQLPDPRLCTLYHKA